MSAIAGSIAAGIACAVAVLVPVTAGIPGLPVFRHPDRRVLETAGWRHGLVRWEGLRLAVLGAALALAAVFGAMPAGLAGAVVPSAIARVRAQEARDRARPATVRLLGTVHAALRSGVPLPEAIRRGIESCDDPIAREGFAHALARFNFGDSLDRALHDAAERSPDARTRIALETLAVGVAERLPVDRAAELVGSVAGRAAHDERLAAEVRARASGARLQVHVLAAIVPGLALYLSVTMPGLAETLGSPFGRTVLVPAAAVLEIAGIVLSRRVVRGVAG